MRTRGDGLMKSLKFLSLSVPFLLVALLPALAADKPDKPDDKTDKTEKMEDTDYYPLKANSVWSYKLGDNTKFRLKAIKEEQYEGKPSVRVEMIGEGDKQLSYENIQVKKDGVYRLGFEGNKADPPVKFMALPAKSGEEWKVDSKIGKETLKGTFKTGKEEKVKVPAGEYDTVYTESDDLDANGMKVKFKTYFAKGVGMVKQEITIGATTVTIELEKYEEGK
jgi:hypothetical protein